MRQIVECVPNFSEGRRLDVVEQIAAAIRQVRGVYVLDVQSDADHNRSVITFVGRPAAVEEAAFRATARAAELIDMTQHKGEHPRMGATDVIPFVPIQGVTMDDCVAMARRVGQRIGEELGIPVYLYEAAATRESRRNLADVRRGEYEGIRAEIETNPERRPDFGPARMGTAGATAVGARPPLIAYNVNLGTSDLKVAKAIARAVRHSSGGLRYVKALGMEIKERGIVQVSMNMTDYRGTPLFRVFEMIKREAARYGVPVVGSEIVGLTPAAALMDAAEFYLQIEDFHPGLVLENRIAEAMEEDVTPDAFLEAVAEPKATPGGGSVAALAGALGAALTTMVAGLTLGKPAYSAVEKEMEALRARSQQLMDELTGLVAEDAAAYQAVVAAYRLPKETEEERAQRDQAIQTALVRAAQVPLTVAERATEVLDLALKAVRLGLSSAASDAGVAAYMAYAAVEGALLNVRVNLKSLKDAAAGEELATKADQLLALAKERLEQVREALG